MSLVFNEGSENEFFISNFPFGPPSLEFNITRKLKKPGSQVQVECGHGDFCSVILYVFTNTDLHPNDVRSEILGDCIKALESKSGGADTKTFCFTASNDGLVFENEREAQNTVNVTLNPNAVNFSSDSMTYFKLSFSALGQLVLYFCKNSNLNDDQRSKFRALLASLKIVDGYNFGATRYRPDSEVWNSFFKSLPDKKQ